MTKRLQDFADRTVQLCLDQYNKLPKNGKPTNEEWTVFSAIVEYSVDTSRVVSLGTGSKCVGAKSLSPHGDIVHDSHAEVMARRGFLIYIMEEIRNWHQNGNLRLFSGMQDGKLVMRENIKYCLVTSAVPCGDAAIMPMTRLGKHINGETDAELPAKKQKTDSDGEEESPIKRLRVDDCHRTGAKCLPSSEQQDPKKPGTEYHLTGQVRTKPGRGDPTTSVTCSDKIARWNAVGIQGALISLLIHKPIFIEQIIVSGGTPFSTISLERAINQRVQSVSKMKFIQSSQILPFGKSDVRKRPAPGSISWNLLKNYAEVCVEGRKIGAIKSATKKSALEISKQLIFYRFVGLVTSLKQLPPELSSNDVTSLCYRDVKNLSKEYQDNWAVYRNSHFKLWTIKPSGLELFKI